MDVISYLIPVICISLGSLNLNWAGSCWRSFSPASCMTRASENGVYPIDVPSRDPSTLDIHKIPTSFFVPLVPAGTRHSDLSRTPRRRAANWETREPSCRRALEPGPIPLGRRQLPIARSVQRRVRPKLHRPCLKRKASHIADHIRSVADALGCGIDINVAFQNLVAASQVKFDWFVHVLNAMFVSF